MSARSRNARRKVLFILLLALLGAGLALITAAGLILTGDLQYGWTRRLGAALERNRAAARPHRVLVIGDSFLTWWPVQHCLKTDIEIFCRERGIGCVNTAIGGYGPIEYADNMLAAAPVYRPGLTLLFYYAGNDLTDVLYRTSPNPRSPAVDSLVVEPPRASNERLGQVRWASLSGGGFFGLPLAALTFAGPGPAPVTEPFDWAEMERHGIDPDLIWRAKNRIANPNGITPDHVNPWLLQLALQSKDNFLLNILMEDPRCMGAWETATLHLRGVHSAAREAGSDMWIIMIPSTLQIDESHFDFYEKATFLMDKRTVGWTRPQELMRAFCESEGISFLDLMPVFQEHPDTASLYWENDDHLSEAGHIAAFEAVRDRILIPWWRKHRVTSAPGVPPERK